MWLIIYCHAINATDGADGIWYVFQYLCWSSSWNAENLSKVYICNPYYLNVICSTSSKK